MNPTHKQKKSKEPDAPQWYIDAHLDSLKNGIGVMVIRHGQDPMHVPPEKYLELAEGLEWVYEQTQVPAKQ